MAGKGAFNKHSGEVVGGSPSNSIATKHGDRLMANPSITKHLKSTGGKLGKTSHPAHGLTHHHKGGHRPTK